MINIHGKRFCFVNPWAEFLVRALLYAVIGSLIGIALFVTLLLAQFLCGLLGAMVSAWPCVVLAVSLIGSGVVTFRNRSGGGEKLRKAP